MSPRRRHRRRPSTSTLLLVLAALLPVAVLAFVLVRRLRTAAAASRTRARAGVTGTVVPAVPSADAVDVSSVVVEVVEVAEVVGPAAAAAAPAPRRRLRRRGHGNVSAVSVAMTSLGLLVLVGVPTTWATFNDQVAMVPISLAAGTVNPPTGLGLSKQPTAIRAAWTAPASGLTPDGYEVFRTTTSGSYGAALASPVSSPYDDTTAAECTPYYYKVRSRLQSLRSTDTAESGPFTIDRTAPVVGTTNGVYTGGPEAVAAYYKLTGGGGAALYANITDNCADPSALTVSFRFGAPVNTTVTPTYSASGWTPVAGGPTYNYRWTTATAPNYSTTYSMSNGSTLPWTVTATDPDGNAATAVAATSITMDGAGPTGHVAETVSAYTNFYDLTLGYGEIPSDGTQAATGVYTYGKATDASGVSSMTANYDLSAALRLKTSTTALTMTPGSYTTFDGGAWGFRSAATVINTGLADGNRAFTVTATDKVGNTATTSANITVEIDDTPISATSASCTNGGTNNNILADPDYTDFNLGDTIYLPSIKTGWTGTQLTANVILRNGTSDYFDFNTDFGLQLFQGTAYNQAYNVALNVVAADTPYNSSTWTLTNRTTMRVGYKTGSISGFSNGNATVYFGTNIRDAAGNKTTANFTETCARNSW